MSGTDGDNPDIELQSKGESTAQEPKKIQVKERKRSARDNLDTTADADEHGGGHGHHEEDWEPITCPDRCGPLAGWRLHKNYVEHPCKCYGCLCCAFWIWWVIMIVCVVSFGEDFLLFTNDFPFWIQSHRTQQAQDGVTMMQKEATYVPGQRGGPLPERSQFDSVAQVIYLASNGQDMLSADMLEKVHDFETRMLDKTQWENDMCWQINGTCQRKSSATLYYANDDENPYQWFPKEYDRIPSFDNTLKYRQSYQSINDYPPNLKFDQGDVSEFWVNYGHQSFENAKPLYSYFDTESCDNEIEQCQRAARGRDIPDLDSPGDMFHLQGNETYAICYDMNEILADHRDERALDPRFADLNPENCPELLEWMKLRNLGCDDSFTIIDPAWPESTLRELCCETCYLDWFPQGDFTIKDASGADKVVNLNPNACGLGVEGQYNAEKINGQWEWSPSTYVDANSLDMLQVCLEHNRGVYQTSTTFTSTLISTTSEVLTDDKVGTAFEQLLTSRDILVQSVTATCSDACDVQVLYPWSSESRLGEELFGTDGFKSALMDSLNAQYTSEVVESVDDVQYSRDTIPGKSSVYEKTVEFNPLWNNVDGTYGEGATMETAKKAKALRSLFYLGLPVKGYDSSANDRDAQIEKMGEYCHDAWQDMLDDGIDGVDIYWYCDTMELKYVQQKLAGDAILIIGTFTFISAFMIFVTGSYFLAFHGMGMLFLNFGPTIVLYCGVFRINFFGILQVMSMFLILSIGADDIFVILDTWGQANVKNWQKKPEERLSFTLRMSGSVMLTTSLSTIASFLANATSAFPAIRTFGIFCAILIFVNYMAVCIFFPICMMIHELYFQEHGSPCGSGCGSQADVCCVFCNCGCKNCFTEKGEFLKERMQRKIDEGEEVPSGEEKRAVDEWFGGAYYDFIHKSRMCVIFVGLVVFVIFTAAAANIVPDPDPPNIYPGENNYYVWGEKFTETFTRQTSDQNVIAWVTWGLDPPGITRPSDHRDTDIEDLGNPKYDPHFNPFSKEGMEFLTAICDDMENGARYGDREDRKIDTQVPGGEYVVQCPFTEFRNWIWNQDPDSVYNMDGAAVNPGTKELLDHKIVNCINKENTANNYEDHTAGDWPIEGFWQNWQRWEDWMRDEMPIENPAYERGKSNYDYFNEQLWYMDNSYWTQQEYKGDAFDWACSDMNGNITGTPKTFQAFVRLSVTASYDFNDGIDLYEKWEDWAEKWAQGTDGIADKYVPLTSHCDGLSPSATCENTKGCTWENFQCSPTQLMYPGEAPRGVQHIIITDGGLFSYFYLQKQLLSECILGIGLALFFAFIILNWATKNYVIATVATCVISIIVVLVIGFTVMVGWKLGILESIIYVMVVGMAVDYVVHLGEAYLEAADVHTDRHSRARDMLETRGFSIISGAVSTLGGISILLAAFVLFFKKFAIVMFFLIFMSLIYSLVFFAAVMDSFGPSGDFGEWQHVIKDMQHVYNGELTIFECCQNCIVPHESEHFNRHMTKSDVLKDVDSSPDPLDPNRLGPSRPQKQPWDDTPASLHL